MITPWQELLVLNICKFFRVYIQLVYCPKSSDFTKRSPLFIAINFGYIYNKAARYSVIRRNGLFC